MLLSLLNADGDWQESLRRYWYPRLHTHFQRLGHGSVGIVGWNQYVGKLDEDEEVIEEALVDRGFQRNPIAYYKRLRDGRDSEGSWVLLHGDAPDYVAPGMQLHVTLFKREDGRRGRELYAHYEDDWRVNPVAHARETRFDPHAGLMIARDYLDRTSFLTLRF